LEKLKIGFYWAASCGGCEIAVLDLNEKILDVLKVADIVFWPVAMDIKYKDVEAMPDGFMDICFFNGAVRTEEQEALAKLLRKKAKTLIAFGACAYTGGIPGLANLVNSKEILEQVYLQSPSTINPDTLVPEAEVSIHESSLTLPKFYDTVMTLDQVVDVDYYLPGCPPTTNLIEDAVRAIVEGNLPSKGSVLAPLKSVCDECPRNKEEKKITAIRRVIDLEPDTEKCLLEQGIVCMGPATRGGCGTPCLNANMPCTGCGGPCPNVPEQGAAMLSSLASLLAAEKERDRDYDPEKLMGEIKDPVGLFYRYSLPASIIKRRVVK
jgi:F420-non-reducing hydrogenase small subunit